MNKDNLKIILDNHVLWLVDKANGDRADLRGADLSGTKDGAICRMDFGGWSICIRSKETSIGCKKRKNEFWLNATDDDISNLDANALEWWKVYGSAIKESIRVIMEISR